MYLEILKNYTDLRVFKSGQKKYIQREQAAYTLVHRAK